MIGNLGKTVYRTLSFVDGNGVNNGNTDVIPAQILPHNIENLFTYQDYGSGTSGTRLEKSPSVPAIPEQQNNSGNSNDYKINSEIQSVTNHVPAVPVVPVNITESSDKTIPQPVPRGRGIWKLADVVGERGETTTEREACYCCKGTDYWLGGTNKYPHWVCRRCHPPAPGAER
jgi:hypothetical protein